MADPLIEIPDKPAFKAAEVCEIAHIPPYVLRSWEKEFPNLGVVARPGATRVYRRGDLEQILRIKQLVFAEGLTLAGARRRLEGEPPPEPEPDLPLPDDVKAKVGKVKEELRSLLQLLGSGLESRHLAPSGTAETPAPRPATWPPQRAVTRPTDAAEAVGVRPPPPPEEPALPLLDAEPEMSAPPPAAAVPVVADQGAAAGPERPRKRRGRRGPPVEAPEQSS